MDWQSLNSENERMSEELMPREFFTQPDSLDMDAEYDAPKTQLSLVIHGSNTSDIFVVPDGFEVVIFSRRGQLLAVKNIITIFQWIRKNQETVQESSLHELHMKRIEFRHSSLVKRALALGERHILSMESGIRAAYNSYRSKNTATLQIFRAGARCPNILLQSDVSMGQKDSGWGFSRSRDADVLEGMTKKYYDRYPSTTASNLEGVLRFIRAEIPGKPIRLYLFCCRALSARPATQNLSPELEGYYGKLSESGTKLSGTKLSGTKFRGTRSRAKKTLRTARKSAYRTLKSHKKY